MVTIVHCEQEGEDKGEWEENNITNSFSKACSKTPHQQQNKTKGRKEVTDEMKENKASFIEQTDRLR